MTDKQYYIVLILLAVLIWIAGAINVFVAGMSIDRLTASFGFVLLFGSWLLVRYCAVQLKGVSNR